MKRGPVSMNKDTENKMPTSLYEAHKIRVIERGNKLMQQKGEWPAVYGKGVRIDDNGNVKEDVIYHLIYLVKSPFVDTVFNEINEKWEYVLSEKARNMEVRSLCSFKSVDRIRIWDEETHEVKGKPLFANQI